MSTSLRVLIVEDRASDAEIVVRELRRAGFEPTWQRVETEPAFLEHLHAGLDLVLSDYEMPHFNGLRALALRNQSGLDIPFILISGTIGEDTAVEAMKHGASDYLMKDRLVRLGTAVEHALDQRRLRSEKRKAEAAVAASEQHYRLLFESNPQPMWVFDSETLRFMAVNPAAVKHYGFTAEEFLARTIRDIRPTESIAVLDETLRQAAPDRPARDLWLHRKKDGTLIRVEISANELLFAGRPARIVLANDVTERRRAEESLKLFRALMDRSQECIEVVDPLTGQMLDVNETTCRVHGYTREEYLKLTVFDVHPALSRERFDGIQKRLQETGALVVEGVHRRKDGTDFPVELSLNRVDLDRNYVVAIARDITERQRAEAALRESEVRFRELAENIQEVFWVTNADSSEMIYVSPGYERIWGRTCESLYAAPREWLEAIRPEDRERVLEAALKKMPLGVYDEEYRIIRPDGSERWIRDRGFPVCAPSGAVVRIVGVAEDITESKNLQEQFLRAQRMEAIGTLAGGIAHDLNNILAPIAMGAGLLKEHLTLPRDQDLIKMIETAAGRGTSVIRQLLTFSRGVGGDRVSVQLRHLLNEMSEIIQETFPRDIALRETAARDLHVIVADPTQLHQVIMNLCVNARDAMPNGGKLTLAARNVDLSVADVAAHAPAKPGPFVAVSVADTGHGIPPEIVGRIFDPFFTTKPPTKGTGLGLSTVLGIVRSHGGFITVASTPRGTEFTIHLPAAVDAAGVAVAPEADALPAGNGELILVVDDEEPIRRTTRLMLEQNGYRVLTASQGAEAVAMFLENRDAVRLVLTDVMMPVMGGVSLIHALHAIEPKLKMIATSGLADQASHAEVVAAGVNGILTKPCSPRELLEIIRTHLTPLGQG